MLCIDAIVVGAGIWGCTVARCLAEVGRRVLVLEKRAFVGGNARCEVDARTGIEVHAYGSHIFHTHNRKVWDFVRRFTEFNGYQHKVLARTRALPPCADERLRAKIESDGGRTYHLPVGLTLINKFFDVELRPEEVDHFLTSERCQAIFDAFFRGYTSKQWGVSLDEIGSSVINRVPVRSNYDTNYFNDYWQGIPSDGYNKLFERLLAHPNIDIRCEAAFRISGLDLLVNGERLPEAPVYYSGPIDELFDYKFGPLPWRSLHFERETLPIVDYQGAAVVNYPDTDIPYTRIHEFKHYHPESFATMQTSGTVIMREYPRPWKIGEEPYYPINNTESDALLARYLREVRTRRHAFVVGGRLGGHRYCDMDQVMSEALEVSHV